MKRSIIIILAMILSAATALAQYRTVTDIPYVTTGNDYALERCKLDVHYSPELKDAPVVVWFHGGGIEKGSKHIDAALRESGYVVIAVNYRLLPKASMDEILDDTAAAVAWAFKHCKEYGGDPNKIFLSGHSAGGYLIDMVGLDKKWLGKYGVDPDDVAAYVPFSGQVLTHYNLRKQKGIGPLQPVIDEYAPLAHVRPGLPPFVIVSGDRELELYGRYEEQAYFYRLLKLVGNENVTLYEMQGYDHGSMAQPAYHILKQTIKAVCKGK